MTILARVLAAGLGLGGTLALAQVQDRQRPLTQGVAESIESHVVVEGAVAKPGARALPTGNDGPSRDFLVGDSNPELPPAMGVSSIARPTG